MRRSAAIAGLALQNRLKAAKPWDTFDVNIFLKGEHAAETLEAMGSEPSDSSAATAVERIKSRVAESQQPLLDFLGAPLPANVAFADGPVSVPHVSSTESFWINNSVAAQVSQEMLSSLLERPEVQFVELARHVPLEQLMDAAAHSKARSSPGRSKGKPNSSGKAERASAADAVTPTWSVTRINAPLLWQLGLTGEGVVVAVIDSGVNYDHPDLQLRMWDGGEEFPNHGYDFGQNDLDPMDDQGHGTACAGIVAGDGTSGSGTGVAPKASVMALKVGGAERNFWRAFQFAIEHGAHVISMSMSWKYPSSPDYPGWRRACETLHAAGILHANSIGNQGTQLATHPIPYNIATPGNCPPPRMHPLQPSPGSLSSPISCGATDDTDSLADYSGRGPAAWETGPYTDYPYANGTQPGLLKPDVCAPGPGTTSCNWLFRAGSSATPYVPFGGTSAATPHVGGSLALLAQACRRAGQPIVPTRIQEALENTAVRVTGQTQDKENHYGSGRIELFEAFHYGSGRGWWS
jgi:subtilisin family serine protease